MLKRRHLTRRPAKQHLFPLATGTARVTSAPACAELAQYTHDETVQWPPSLRSLSRPYSCLAAASPCLHEASSHKPATRISSKRCWTRVPPPGNAADPQGRLHTTCCTCTGDAQKNTRTCTHITVMRMRPVRHARWTCPPPAQAKPRRRHHAPPRSSPPAGRALTAALLTQSLVGPRGKRAGAASRRRTGGVVDAGRLSRRWSSSHTTRASVVRPEVGSGPGAPVRRWPDAGSLEHLGVLLILLQKVSQWNLRWSFPCCSSRASR